MTERSPTIRPWCTGVLNTAAIEWAQQQLDAVSLLPGAVMAMAKELTVTGSSVTIFQLPATMRRMPKLHALTRTAMAVSEAITKLGMDDEMIEGSGRFRVLRGALPEVLGRTAVFSHDDIIGFVDVRLDNGQESRPTVGCLVMAESAVYSVPLTASSAHSPITQ